MRLCDSESIMIMILIGKKYEKNVSKAWFYFSVLRKLTVNGFVEPHKNMEVMVSERSHLIFLASEKCLVFSWMLQSLFFLFGIYLKVFY